MVSTGIFVLSRLGIWGHHRLLLQRTHVRAPFPSGTQPRLISPHTGQQTAVGKAPPWTCPRSVPGGAGAALCCTPQRCRPVALAGIRRATKAPVSFLNAYEIGSKPPVEHSKIWPTCCAFSSLLFPSCCFTKSFQVYSMPNHLPRHLYCHLPSAGEGLCYCGFPQSKKKKITWVSSENKFLWLFQIFNTSKTCLAPPLMHSLTCDLDSSSSCGWELRNQQQEQVFWSKLWRCLWALYLLTRAAITVNISLLYSFPDILPGANTWK